VWLVLGVLHGTPASIIGDNPPGQAQLVAEQGAEESVSKFDSSGLIEDIAERV